MRAGAVLLSIWSGINLLLAVGIIVSMLVLGRHAPALTMYVGETRLRALDQHVVGVVDALAIFGNGCAAAFCALVLVLVWRGVTRGVSWAWPALAVTAGGLQALGFASDARLDHRGLAVNLGSTAVLATGLTLCWLAGQRSEAQTSEAQK